MNQLAELNYHTDRVMGLALDPRNLSLYSCSTDKTFFVTDLKNISSNILINMGLSGYTNLELDSPNKRIFLTNENGELSVFSLAVFPPVLVRNYRNSYIITAALVKGKLNQFCWSIIDICLGDDAVYLIVCAVARKTVRV